MKSSPRLVPELLVPEMSALTTLVIVSCAPGTIDVPCPPVTVGPLLVTRQPTREVDILLVVDNSGDMDEEQRRLVAQLPRLTDAILREARDDEDVDLRPNLMPLRRIYLRRHEPAGTCPYASVSAGGL